VPGARASGADASPRGAPSVQADPKAPEPADLSPTLRIVGPEGVTPDQLVIQFPARAERLVDRGPGDASLLRFEPPIEGDLGVLGPSTWVFEPAEPGFAPGTRYTARLEAVATRDGVLEASEPWTLDFSTPSFGLLRLGPVRLDKGRVQVDVVFSAPVAAGAFARFATWHVDGRRVPPPTYRATPHPHIVQALLAGTGAREGAEVRLRLAAGLPGQDLGITAAAGEASARHEPRPEVRVLAVVRREGPSGHYLDVICDDAGAEGRRSFWDRDTYDYYEVSRRCLPSPDSAKEHIRVEPGGETNVVASAAGFRVLGRFPRGALSLRIDAGLETVDGGRLAEPIERSFVVPPRSASLSFAAQGRYLPRTAWRNLAVRHMSVEELKLSVRHVPRTNLVFWLSGGSERADARASNLVLEEAVAVTNPPDEQTTTWVDVGGLVPDPKPGVYEVAVAARGVKTAARLLLTDLNLVAKRAAPEPGKEWPAEVYVWALGMEDIQPRPGVLVDLVRKSGQTLTRCTTGRAGGCRLTVPDKGIDPSPPFALIASAGPDFTYLKFADLEVSPADAVTHGPPYRDARPYRAGLYADRDVFRPGETVHAVAIVRGRDDRAPAAGLPLEVQLVDPRQRVARREHGRTNSAGVVAFDLSLADFAPTGRYRLEALVGKERIGQLRFSVEEFVPERMKAAASLTAPHYLGTDAASVRATARYLFGGSAEGSRVELTCRLEPSGFSPDEAGGFTYGDASPDAGPRTVTLGTVAGSLDAEGATTLTCPAAATRLSYPGRIVADVAVMEAGSGRATRARAEAPVHPERFYLGLKTRAERAEPGQELTVEGVVSDWTGKPTGGVARVAIEVSRLVAEHGWYFDEDDGEEHWRRHLRAVPEATLEAEVRDGRFSARFTPNEAGAGYRFRASAGRARTTLKLDGTEQTYDWWGGGRQSKFDQTPRPQRPLELRLDAPETIDVGQLARVAVHAPYKGRALFTVETDRVETAEWRDVIPGENAWTFTVDRFRPNVYVGVLLVKDPYLDSRQAFLPDRAVGVRSVRVNPSDYRQQVSMKLPDEVRPNQPLKVELDLGPVGEPTFATVAAVDEGILSLTGYQPPDPVELLFEPRALGTSTFETIGWALRTVPGGPSARTGGGAKLDGGAGRIMPVRPVALWSGVVPVPADGRLTLALDVPQYRGALRLMAVTAGAGRLGHAHGRVLVRDPLVLQTTLPRFLTAGDRVEIPVFLTNLSGASRDVTVELRASEEPVAGLTPPPGGGSPLEVQRPTRKRLTLADGASGTVAFAAWARREAGAARVRVSARSGDLVSWDEVVVPFSPSGPRERRTHVVELAPGATDLKPLLGGWVPTSERSTFWVTTLPEPTALSHLSHLIRYPYGCLEQTTSSTRPLLFVSTLVQGLDGARVEAKGGIDEMVKRGLDRVLSMQTPSGGFAYWPGGTHPNRWGSAYATHLLLDASAKGYRVDKARLDEALAWLEAEVGNLGDSTRAEGAAAYMHYVLARAGRARKARLRQLVRATPRGARGEAAERRYVLLAALHHAGDRRNEAELKRLDVRPLSKDRRTGGTFYSDLRWRGRALATFVELFGPDPAGERLAELVAKGLSEQRSGWYTTQELVWGVTGLGRWLEASRAAAAKVSLLVDGKPVAASANGEGAGPAWSLARASERGSLALRVDGDLAGRHYLLIQSHGVRTGQEVTEGGEGLGLTRDYLDAAGAPLDVGAGAVGLGDLIFTRVRLTNTTDGRMENVALVDRFPAGWELENPRLGRDNSADWADPKQAWDPAHQNLRDDRLEMFGDLEKGGTVEVVYSLRATSAGSFTAPPVEAEAMYDPSRWARRRGGRVEVSGPWAPYLN